MDRIIEKAQQGVSVPHPQSDENPFEELERYFRDPLVSKRACPEVIPWWGVSISSSYSIFNLCSTEISIVKNPGKGLPCHAADGP